MKRLWPKTKTSIILKYLIVISIISIVANIWYVGGIGDIEELSVEDISDLNMNEIKGIEVSIDNILYQLPQDQYQNVLNAIGSLKPARLFSRKDEATTICSIDIVMKKSIKIRLLTKRKDVETPEVIFLEQKDGHRVKNFGSTYYADNICSEIINKK